jgi:hypothetical protein
VVARKIWLRRNSLVFEGIFQSPNELYAEAVSYLEDFKSSNKEEDILEDSFSIADPAQSTLVWKPPTPGFMKVNWDASLNHKEGCIGMGIIAGDCKGRFLGARSLMKKVDVDPKTAEAMAGLWAVKF